MSDRALKDGLAEVNKFEDSRRHHVVHGNTGIASFHPFSNTYSEKGSSIRRSTAGSNRGNETPVSALTQPYIGKLVPEWGYPSHNGLPLTANFRFDIMRHWLETCKAIHEEHCRPLEPIPGEPQWLINVNQNCIEMAPEAAEYATLSYVWGIQQKAVDTSCLTLRNYHQLLEPGSLDVHFFHLSPAIRQSMTMAKEFGFQYLWVDKLCIVQDGPTKQQQLDAMASIYAGSALTIVAAYGQNEDNGLLEPNRAMYDPTGPWRHKRFKVVKMQLDLRRPPPGEINLSEFTHFNLMDWQCQQLVKSRWYSRGWAFQESIFARRMIFFYENTFNWECHCTSWQEAQGVFPHGTHTRCSRTLIDGGSTLNPTLFSDLYGFARLLNIYNQRDLTFPEDAIDAFAGALFDLSKVFPQGFVAGMPVLFFDAMLMWQPSKPMMRRVSARARIADETDDDNPLPSWSWVGWKGSIDLVSLKSAMSYMKSRGRSEWSADEPTRNWGSWHTIPTINWSHTAELDVYASRNPDIPRRSFQLLCPGYLDRNPRINIPQLPDPRHLTDAQSDDFEPPDGWQKAWHPETQTWYYTHNKIGDEEFLYPIPVKTGPTRTLRAVNRSRFLYGRTRRAYLKGQKFFRSRSEGVCVELAPSDQAMLVAGVLRLNASWDGGYEAAFRLDKPIELIELSRGTAWNMHSGTRVYDFDEWDTKEVRWMYTNPRTYEFYNVMWIDRNESNDVAYRKAVGRIRKNVWEDIAKDYIHVTMG